MNKIGILTFWNVPNYGGFLQAYALQKTIEKLCPQDDVRQIAYLDDVHYAKYYSIIPKGNKFWIVNPFFYKNLICNIKQSKLIKKRREFLDYYKMIKSTQSYKKKQLKRAGFDYLVIGSDIVWDYSIGFFNKDKFFWGHYIGYKKCISYAPSFGTVDEFSVLPEYVIDGLGRMAAISVRDEKSKKIVETSINRSASVVADPTLLWNFSDDDNIPCRQIDEKYMVVYGSVFSDEMMKEAREYANNHNLKIVCLDSLDDSYDWVDISIGQDEISPFEWCSYFRYAELVLTCTYHGVMFGLIFKKKIVFNPTPFILDKMSSLVEYLDLEVPLIEEKSFEGKVDYAWDYKNEIDPKIDELREKSMFFLKNALKE